MAEKKLRMGILGCGGIANAHARSICALDDDYELVAYCDINKQAADRFKVQYGQGKGVVFEDFNAMFEQVEMDVVTICLPPFAHEDEVEVASAKGLHIMIEKPIALTMEKANAMTAAVEKAGVKSQVGFMMRFLDVTEKIKALMAGGQGPSVQYIGRYMCNSLHSPWWRFKDKSGGQMVEQIIHQFDLCRYLMGQPVQVFAYANNVAHADVDGYDVEDVSGTVIRFANGGVGVISGTNCAIPGKWLAPSTFVAGGFIAEWGVDQTRITHTHRPDGMAEDLHSTRNTNLAQHQDLIQAIRSGGDTRTPMREGMETLKLVLGARQSAETGKPVDLK